MMRRCVVSVVYQEGGIIPNYLVYLLRSFQPITANIYVVVNGELEEESEKTILSITDRLWKRENKGYDAGAYKDFFTKYIKIEELKEYDEIILSNDTFYGPFFPWSYIFDQVKRDSCDCWGLSRDHGGHDELIDGRLVSVTDHIQSFFIVIKRRVFIDHSFMGFWENLDYPDRFANTVVNFELAFSAFCAEKGFSLMGLFNSTDVAPIDRIEMGYPILKYKDYRVSEYNKLNTKLQYIKTRYNYPVEYIHSDVLRKGKYKNITPYNPYRLVMFCKLHRHVYLFGNGKVSENVSEFLNDRGIKVYGIIVSSPSIKTEIQLDGMILDKQDCIVVAVGKKVLSEVRDQIKHLFLDDNLFFPVYE